MCDNDLKWSPTLNLHCVPERNEVAANEVVNRFGQDSVHVTQERQPAVQIDDNRVSVDNSVSVDNVNRVLHENSNHVSHENANRVSHVNQNHVSHEHTNRVGYPPPVISGERRKELGFEVHETARRINPVHHVKPFIKCPQDTTIILPKGQKTVYIKLEQPKTNVDWWK